MSRTHEEHEALCRRCGMSCHFAVPVNGLAVVVDELRCRFLTSDEGGHRCGVYERRFEAAPWCQTVESALAGGFLAQDCPYARGVRGYRGKVRLGAGLLRQVLPAIRAELARAGAPIGVDPERAVALLQQGGGAWSYSVSEDGARYLFRCDAAEPAPGDAPEPAPGALSETADAPPSSPRRLPVL